METFHKGQHWHSIDDERVQCDICPRYCKLHEGQRGACFVRQCVNHQIVLTTYGRSSGFCIDPIEKKPLNHFFPGSSVLSFGTAGCNLACKFCQNWDISKAKSMDTLMQSASPKTLADAAKQYGCTSVAFTYNDPVVFYEYALDCAQAAQETGVKTVAVTAAYITENAREAFFSKMDAVNVDLKAFNESFYKRICGGHLQNVLDNLLYLKHETSCWFEITTLLIPETNDSDAEIHSQCEWILNNLGTDIPVHFTAFHPDWKMMDKPHTPAATLINARNIAINMGLKFVYVGNVLEAEASATYCPGCNKAIIKRNYYAIDDYHIQHGQCEYCGQSIPGHFSDDNQTWKNHGWGNKRQSIALIS